MSNALQKFDGLSKDEIIDNLEAECIEVLEDFYLKPFTDEELIDAKSHFAEVSREVAVRKDKIKQVTDPLKAEIKPYEEQAKELLTQLKSGGVNTKGRIYLIPDYDNRIVIKYDEDGRIVGTRPFSQKERQLTINKQP